jgi:hypothetical protein
LSVVEGNCNSKVTPTIRTRKINPTEDQRKIEMPQFFPGEFDVKVMTMGDGKSKTRRMTTPEGPLGMLQMLQMKMTGPVSAVWLLVALVLVQVPSVVEAQDNSTSFPTFAPAAINSTLSPTSVATSLPSAAPITSTPTATPVATTLAPTFQMCDICPVGQEIQNLVGLYEDRTCDAWRIGGQRGLVSPSQCTELQGALLEICECAFPTTPIPTASPVTAAPTAVVTQQATVVMVLINVTDSMSPVHRNYFGPTMAAYLEEKLVEGNPAFRSGWTATLAEQLALDDIPVRDNVAVRRGLRHLQQSVPLATQTTVTVQLDAEEGADVTQAELELLLQETLEADTAGFLARLVNTSSPTLLVYFEKISTITVFPADTNFTTAPPPPDDRDEPVGDGDGIELWLVVAIAAGVGGCLLITAFVLLCVLKPETTPSKPASPLRSPISEANGGFSTSPTKAPSNRSATTKARPSAAASVAVDDEDTMYGNASLFTHNQGNDDNSYAYSLDAGHVDNASLLGNSKYSAAVIPADQTLADDSQTINTRRGPMVVREILAPPGKLGIVIDTTLDGPVVHKVNENSPLQGKVFKGDIITSINGIDTRAMKASAITGIMVRTAHEQRNLTVASEDRV